MIALPDNMGLASITTGEFFIGRDLAITRRPGQAAWGVLPDVPLASTPTADLARQRHWLGAGVVAAPPGSTVREQPAPTSAPASLVDKASAEALAVDAQLARAAELLGSPEQMREILAGPSATTAAAETRPAEEEQ